MTNHALLTPSATWLGVSYAFMTLSVKSLGTPLHIDPIPGAQAKYANPGPNVKKHALGAFGIDLIHRDRSG